MTKVIKICGHRGLDVEQWLQRHGDPLTDY